MLVDNWNYYDDGDRMLIVNTFSEDLSKFQCNVYSARKKDIKKNVSVHDVMKLVEEMN
tara:strand:- start:53 stop:226 length:174 start_codon:yes stop_codon:yes gene_type:complete